MKFNNYLAEKEKNELIAFLKEHDIEFTNEEIKVLLEAGWWDSTKKALRTGALVGASVAAMAPNWKDTTAKPYDFNASKMYVNQQKDMDDSADKKYIAAGGHEFKQTLEDAEYFVKNRNSPQHKMALQKAGLPSNYIPTVLRSFVYGDEISAYDEFRQEEVTIIENEVKKKFGRDSSVHLVSSEDAVTGGKTILVRISGVVVATDEQDAVRRASVVIQEIAKEKGYDVAGFRSLDTDEQDISVRQAPRSAMDFTAEAAGQPIRFNIMVKFLVRK
jgi:hypothetical protein